MKRKCPLIVISVLTVLALAIVILSTVTISSPRIKDLVAKQAEKALGRKVQIGDLRINLLRGIRAEKITIDNAPGFGKDPFLEGDSFVLKFNLLPLFRKQVVINKVYFLSPRILIERNQEGAWNFPRLMSTVGKPGEEKKKVRGKGLVFFLSEMNLRRGEITWRDRRLSSANSEVRVRDADFKLAGLSPFSPAKIEASAEVQGALLELSGEGNIFRKEGNFHLKMEGFDLTRISPAYKDLLPFKILRGEVDLDLGGGIEGAKNLSSSGKISLKNIALEKMRNLSGDIVYKIEADLEKQSLSIKEIEGNFNNIIFLLRGGVKEFAKKPVLDLEVEGELPLEEVSKLLEGESPERPLILEGRGKLELVARGDLKNPEVKGDFQLPALKLARLALDNLRADFLLAKGNLGFRVGAKSYGGKLNSSGSLDLSSFTYKVQGVLQDFDLNKYLSAVTSLKDMVSGTLESSFTFSGRRGKDIKKDITGKVSIKVGEGKLGGSALQKQLAGFLNVPLLGEIEHKGIKGNFDIGKGVISTDDLRIDGIDGDFLIKGTLNSEGDLNYTINIILPAEYAYRISEDEKIVSLFRNQEGKTEVPVKVGGNLKSLAFKFGLDMDSLKRRAKERFKEEAKKGLEEILRDWLRP